MRFIFGRGMISDDTEHTLMVAQALLEHPDDVVGFQCCLAWKLRWWFVGFPAGVGLATAKACIKLWLGFSPTRSGVYSAGNGPAMRSAIIGAFFATEPKQLEAFVRATTIITHSDPKAIVGAMAIAQLAAWSVRNPNAREPNLPEIFELLRTLSSELEWTQIVESMYAACQQQTTVEELATRLGEKGVSGYIFHTVPVAVYAWLRHFGDFETGVTAALNCGGDADTVGAIAGALFGITVGDQDVPKKWLGTICDFPRSPALLARVADRLATLKTQKNRDGQVAYFWPALLIRNVLFLGIVIAHGFRRMLPPY